VYGNYKELFNHYHAIIRNHIESHRCCEEEVPYSKIPVAIVVFHNIIKSWNGEEGWLDQLPCNTQLSQYADVLDGDVNYATNSESIDRNSLRDQTVLPM
jgi:hypothetical protein